MTKARRLFRRAFVIGNPGKSFKQRAGARERPSYKGDFEASVLSGLLWGGPFNKDCPGHVQQLFRGTCGVKHDTALRMLPGQLQKTFTNPGMKGQGFSFKAPFVK